MCLPDLSAFHSSLIKIQRHYNPDLTVTGSNLLKTHQQNHNERDDLSVNLIMLNVFKHHFRSETRFLRCFLNKPAAERKRYHYNRKEKLKKER